MKLNKTEITLLFKTHRIAPMNLHWSFFSFPFGPGRQIIVSLHSLRVSSLPTERNGYSVAEGRYSSGKSGRPTSATPTGIDKL